MAAPVGNQNAAKGRRWQDALNKALARYESKDPSVSAGEALDAIALHVVERAIDGNWDAISEIGNRLDGKAAQSLMLSGDADNPLVHRIERAIVRSNAKD